MCTWCVYMATMVAILKNLLSHLLLNDKSYCHVYCFNQYNMTCWISNTTDNLKTSPEQCFECQVILTQDLYCFNMVHKKCDITQNAIIVLIVYLKFVYIVHV